MAATSGVSSRLAGHVGRGGGWGRLALGSSHSRAAERAGATLVVSSGRWDRSSSGKSSGAAATSGPVVSVGRRLRGVDDHGLVRLPVGHRGGPGGSLGRRSVLSSYRGWRTSWPVTAGMPGSPGALLRRGPLRTGHAIFGEWREGTSPSRSRRTGRETLASSGPHRSADCAWKHVPVSETARLVLTSSIEPGPSPGWVASESLVFLHCPSNEMLVDALG